jgi:hypothetical protein
MPEDHRRVEPRSIVGTGMATGPERLAQIEQDAARMQRAWREAPEERFGDVLGRSPARADMVDADVPDRRRAAAQAAEAEAAATTPAPAATTTQQPPRPTRLSPRAPDPREQQLRNALAARQTPPSTSGTPPTAKR